MSTYALADKAMLMNKSRSCSSTSDVLCSVISASLSNCTMGLRYCVMANKAWSHREQTELSQVEHWSSTAPPP